jgi:predicted transcriptional regulator
MKTKQKLSLTLRVRVDPDTVLALSTLAKWAGSDRSKIIRTLILHEFRRHAELETIS